MMKIVQTHRIMEALNSIKNTYIVMPNNGVTGPQMPT